MQQYVLSTKLVNQDSMYMVLVVINSDAPYGQYPYEYCGTACPTGTTIREFPNQALVRGSWQWHHAIQL